MLVVSSCTNWCHQAWLVKIFLLFELFPQLSHYFEGGMQWHVCVECLLKDPSIPEKGTVSLCH